MEFTWGDLVPNGMTCQNCGATWEPDMSYDVEWVFTSATLVKLGKERKGSSLLNRMYSADFWKELASPNPRRTTKKEPSQNNHRGRLTESSSSVKLSRYAAGTAVAYFTKCRIGVLTAGVEDDDQRFA
jgi:hypothetical protein